MALTFQAVTLDTDSPDAEAVLVLRGGRLVAVLSCLSDLHDDLEGHWFVEAAFGPLPRSNAETFESLSEFESWITEVGRDLP